MPTNGQGPPFSPPSRHCIVINRGDALHSYYWRGATFQDVVMNVGGDKATMYKVSPYRGHVTTRSC